MYCLPFDFTPTVISKDMATSASEVPAAGIQSLRAQPEEEERQLTLQPQKLKAKEEHEFKQRVTNATRHVSTPLFTRGSSPAKASRFAAYGNPPNLLDECKIIPHLPSIGLAVNNKSLLKAPFHRLGSGSARAPSLQLAFSAPTAFPERWEMDQARGSSLQRSPSPDRRRSPSLSRLTKRSSRPPTPQLRGRGATRAHSPPPRWTSTSPARLGTVATTLAPGHQLLHGTATPKPPQPARAATTAASRPPNR